MEPRNLVEAADFGARAKVGSGSRMCLVDSRDLSDPVVVWCWLVYVVNGLWADSNYN
jgi:hypothetical protein